MAVLVSASWVISAGRVEALDVGTKAPPMAITEWVQGEPVEFPRDFGKRVYLVEFWATWCPPCKMSVPLLTRVQDKFRKDLAIIGVTSPDDRGNSTAAIRRFVSEQGGQMSYSVAIDKDERTTMAYLGAAQVDGIPYSFLVGRDGRVVWHGSPLDPEMEDIVSKVVAGRYDVESAKKAKEVSADIDRRFQEVELAARAQRWSNVWDGLVGILKLDPGNLTAMDLLTQVYVNEMHDGASYRAWARDHITNHGGNAEAMHRLAMVLCVNDDLGSKLPDLALEAARAAYEASGSKDDSAVATYALAAYQVGALDRAISLQQEVVDLTNREGVSEAQRRDAEAVLAFYTKCKQLQSSIP